MYMLCLYNVFEDFYVFSIDIPCISTTFDENTWQTQCDHSVNPCYIISHGRMCLRVFGQTLPEYGCVLITLELEEILRNGNRQSS